MPRTDLSTEEKGLEFSLRCPHWRREGNKHLVGNLAVGMGSKSWGSGGGWGLLSPVVTLINAMWWAGSSITGSRISVTD